MFTYKVKPNNCNIYFINFFICLNYLPKLFIFLANKMSKELYPSNSSIIDIRSKISSLQAPSKTKQFINDLHRHSGIPMEQYNPNRTYESERWFTPKPMEDINTSLPPRRSMFTPSRLQNISAQRNRETRKPYWRCPMPTINVSRKKSPTLLSEVDVERILQSSSMNENPSSNLQITLKTIAPMKSFRRREPESGKKINVFNIDDEEITIEGDDNSAIERELANVQPPILSGIPKPGFLTNDNAHMQQSSTDDLVFTFSDPIIRGPKTPAPLPLPISKSAYKETGIQTEAEIHLTEPIEKSIQIDERPAKAIEELPTVTAPLEIVNNGIGSPANQAIERISTIQGAFNGIGNSNFGLSGLSTLPGSAFQFGASTLNGPGAAFQFSASAINGNGNLQIDNATLEAKKPTEPASMPGVFNGIGGEFNFPSSGASNLTSAFQFGAPTQNGTGAFQFGGMTSDGDGGLSARTGARKLLQARRMKKR